MNDIVGRLRLDAVRCELHFSKGVADNIEGGIAEIERLRDEVETWVAQGQRVAVDNERLRALLEECRPYVANASHWDVALIASIDAALDTPHRALEGK